MLIVLTLKLELQALDQRLVHRLDFQVRFLKKSYRLGTAPNRTNLTLFFLIISGSYTNVYNYLDWIENIVWSDEK